MCDDRGTIAYLEHEWNDADMKRDAAWFERNFASNFTNISSRTGKLTRKADEIQDLKTRKETMTSEDLSDMQIRMAGSDTAVVTGIVRVQGRGDNKPIDQRVAYTDVWVKRDGRWQVMSSQGTNIKE